MTYIGIGPESGKVVQAQDAYDYALNAVQNDDHLKAEFTEWFFSGSWTQCNDPDDEIDVAISEIAEAMQGLGFLDRVLTKQSMAVALEALERVKGERGA